MIKQETENKDTSTGKQEQTIKIHQLKKQRIKAQQLSY
jgi:hypothetical protein